ncbi:MAG: archaeosortase/exosortase family protein [Bacteroidia bacterium]
MNLSFYKNPIIRFLINVFIFYIGWYCVYNLWLHPQQKIDLWVIDFTITISKWLLIKLGYVVFSGGDRLIGIDGTGGLWIGDNCNGIALFALFAGFIAAYNGKFNHKVIYIILGIIGIELLNVLRVVILAILDTYSRTWTEFNHTYTFTFIIYAFIFLLWMLWVNKFSKITINTST